jgi:glutathione synthase/RimK-type ligase-like ATP-grasp enzyme
MSKPKRVALATCADYPQLADDEPLLLEALRARDVDAEPVVWDDDAIDWRSYDLVIVRCTWDWSWRVEQFLAWAESVPRLLNAPEVLRWNIDKTYLRELPGAVPTQFVQDGEDWQVPGPEFVVKPTVSSGSRHTGRYSAGEEAKARAHVHELTSEGRTAMIQPYLTAVDEHGETGLVFLGGEYSHAFRKGQLLHRGNEPATGLFVQEQIAPRTAGPGERELAERVLDSLPWPRANLLYARVDMISGPNGEPQLVELELTEPSLYFSYGDGAAARLAELVIERL